MLNEDRFNELFAAETKDTIQLIEDSMFKINVVEIFNKMARLLVEDRQHELIMLAKELGKMAHRTIFL
ncbi:hypothetical protein PACILC2_49990 [Paenibacillus cisolokensis]|uniref:Uncharacterized protein n=1 Tax=Paenibacillus cisolokensis TaxID=1658519 RepID=A0ABQ4NDZ1_9BACL|nr:hypothetical protein [Paenibacillus cisolokensis]GIQ66431.1 hypothetical protein PACILC2_49990 [Paenibacillus cisolokensis]